MPKHLPAFLVFVAVRLPPAARAVRAIVVETASCSLAVSSPWRAFVSTLGKRARGGGGGAGAADIFERYTIAGTRTSRARMANSSARINFFFSLALITNLRSSSSLCPSYRSLSDPFAFT